MLPADYVAVRSNGRVTLYQPVKYTIILNEDGEMPSASFCRAHIKA